MTESIPVSLLEKWIDDLQAALKQADQGAETGNDLAMNLGMRHGLDQMKERITTWLRHQKYGQTLRRLGRDFLMVRRVNLSEGRYRKLEWYEDDQFLVLAWLHAKDAPTGELLLEIENTKDMSKTFLVYHGGLSYDNLAALAREGGLGLVRNEGNQGDWVEKVWT